MAAQDTVNRVYREFKRYSGDGLPGAPVNAPLPVGDPSSGVHTPNKAELRAALFSVASDGADAAQAVIDENLAVIDAARQSALDASEGAEQERILAEAAAGRAQAAQPGAYPVSRAALKALDTAVIKTAYLTEMGREGNWVWRAGDYSTQIAADTLEAVFIKANAIATTAGAWVRAFDGRNNSANFWGLPSVTLFGAVGDNSFNNATIFTSLPASSEITFRVPTGVYVIGTNCTINGNLAFDPGAVILVAAGVTVTCNGKVYAQEDQVILRYGSNTSHFYLGAKNKRVPVNWFYVPDDNGTASISPFVNDQMELWPNDGREFLLPKGKRLLDTVWNLRDRNFCSIRGAGGLIRSQIDTNTIPKWPGGGSSLVLAPGLDYAIYAPDSGVAGKRISGLTVDGVGFIGNSEKTVNQGGIFINEDNDGVIIQNCFFINLVGQFAILAYNADAMTIENNWIAEGTRSIKVENSIELRIINNHLGAQPGGITVDLVNAERFLVSNNNIFPDGQTNVAVTNSRIGAVADNVMHSRFVGAVVITGCYAVGLIDNVIRVPHNTTTAFPVVADPLARDTQYGVVRVVTSDDCLIDGNQIWSFLPANSAVVRHVSGNRCEYVGGMIRGNASTAKFVQDAGTDVKVIDLVNSAAEATFNGGTRGARYKP